MFNRRAYNEQGEIARAQRATILTRILHKCPALNRYAARYSSVSGVRAHVQSSHSLNYAPGGKFPRRTPETLLSGLQHPVLCSIRVAIGKSALPHEFCNMDCHST